MILVLELVTKRQELSEEMSDKSDERYNILCKGELLYSNLTGEEYFDLMENLSIEFYQTGSPDPSELETEIIGG
mgnify:CR=1 FL=1